MMSRKVIAVGTTLLVIIIMAIAFFVLDKDRGQVDGGPCRYRTTPYPARVIFFEVTGNDKPKIVLETNVLGRIDTISYYLEIDALQARNVEVGDTLTYEHHEIIKGTCKPEFYVVNLKKYRNNE